VFEPVGVIRRPQSASPPSTEARGPARDHAGPAADHLIEDTAAFLKAVQMGARLAQEGALVTFGIRPERPDTGYGYIQLGSRMSGKGG